MLSFQGVSGWVQACTKMFQKKVSLQIIQGPHHHHHHHHHHHLFALCHAFQNISTTSQTKSVFSSQYQHLLWGHDAFLRHLLEAAISKLISSSSRRTVWLGILSSTPPKKLPGSFVCAVPSHLLLPSTHVPGIPQVLKKVELGS